jgi:hypothetical protein
MAGADTSATAKAESNVLVSVRAEETGWGLSVRKGEDSENSKRLYSFLKPRAAPCE